MKPQILSATVVIGLGLVGIALAQQAPDGAARDARARRRGQIARLQARVELLEMEHKVDADLLEKLMSDVKNMDGLEAMKDQLPGIIGALGQVLGQKVDAGAVEKEFPLDSATIKAVRPLLERKKEEFLRQSEELHEKRLELADLEKERDAGAR